MRSPIQQAKALALKAYSQSDQMDVFEHSGQVVENLRRMQEIIETVAWLHDVVEDTDVTNDDIRLQFGDVIANAVAALTKGDDEFYHDEYLPRVKANPFAWIVKAIGDVPHNQARPRVTGWSDKRIASMQRRYSKALEQLSF